MHFSTAHHATGFLFWKAESVWQGAYTHNMEPIISALGNGDGIDHWVPRGALSFRADASTLTITADWQDKSV